MAHVTVVVRPSGTIVNSAMLLAVHGLMNSSCIDTWDGDDASVISMRPLPALPVLLGFLKEKTQCQRQLIDSTVAARA